MNEVSWTALPLPNVPEWNESQSGLKGLCRSCDKDTWLRSDPYAGQQVCRPCWEALVYGADD